jgi:hypothetical protein
MIRRLTRIALALPLVAAGAGATSSIARQGPAAPLCAQAASSHRVGLVVEHADGQVIRRCVGFNAPTATALGVLQGSGLEVGISSYGGGLGAAICQIDNEPAMYPPSCFTASGSYWVLFVSHAGGAWVASAVGASNVTVANGDDIGFRFDSQSGADPPPPSPEGTCPALTPPPATTPTPTVGATLRPHATSTASPAASTSRPAPQPPTSTPTAGVLGIVTPGATPAVTGALTQAIAHPGVNVGLLLAAIGAGALVGLLGTQALRRRRE